MSADSSFAALLVVALLVSGCAGAGPNSATNSGPPISTVATFTPDTGGIEGVVLDEEAKPVGGATVGIVGVGTVVKSSAAGAFAFSELEPGDYKLAVEAVGFHDTVVPARVVAGNTTKITFRLVAVATTGEGSLDNFLSATNNVVWLHIISSPRKYWMNDTQKTGAGETQRAGMNALAWALGAGSAGFSIPLEPELAAPVLLDKGKTVDITLFVGPFFTANDVGKLTVSVEVMNGATRIAAGAAKEVTIMPDTIEELKWSVNPETDVIDNMMDLTWVIKADGATVGMSIGAKNNVKSSIAFPVK